MTRQYSLLDRLLMQVDAGLQTVLATQRSVRSNPADTVTAVALTPTETRDSQGYMRVNHTGEVCAQALYRGQLVLARDDKTKAMLEQGALEETDHLAWTHARLDELKTHRSYLNGFWYVNAFMMGVLVSAIGDRWSLGFIEETERQVSAHLTGHLRQLPENDLVSRRIIEQMRDDEEAHGRAARAAGAADLPPFAVWIMQCHAKIMTTLVYWL